MSYLSRSVALCAVCSLLLPVAAQGQTGKPLDPDSPAGVEYQLPLEQARKNVGGGDRAGGPAPLFGAGVVAAGKSVTAKAGGAGGEAQGDSASEEGSSRSGAGGKAGRDSGATPGSTAIKQATLGAPDEDGGSATLRIAGIALAVLLVGGLLGLVLRRGLRHAED